MDKASPDLPLAVGPQTTRVGIGTTQLCQGGASGPRLRHYGAVPLSRGQQMGIFDKVTDVVSDHADQIKDGIDKVGDFVDGKTDAKYADQVDQAQDFISDQVDKLGN